MQGEVLLPNSTFKLECSTILKKEKKNDGKCSAPSYQGFTSVSPSSALLHSEVALSALFPILYQLLSFYFNFD